MKVERSQFKGIKVALGYRNSTPTNIIIEEFKMQYL